MYHFKFKMPDIPKKNFYKTLITFRPCCATNGAHFEICWYVIQLGKFYFYSYNKNYIRVGSFINDIIFTFYFLFVSIHSITKTDVLRRSCPIVMKLFMQMPFWTNMRMIKLLCWFEFIIHKIVIIRMYIQTGICIIQMNGYEILLQRIQRLANDKNLVSNKLKSRCLYTKTQLQFGNSFLVSSFYC